MQQNKLNQNGFHVVELVIVIVVAGILGFIGWFVYNKQQSNTQTNTTTNTSTSSQVAAKSWMGDGIAVEGTYADADVVSVGGGKYRMYYGIQPEVQGNQLEIYSSTSTDGKTWKQEPGTRKTMATFPDVVKLDDGTWRIYYQNANAIKSATSKDGLSWTDEPGTRITTSNDENLDLDNVAASTTLRRADGTYLMVYRGQIDKKYSSTTPNQQTGLLLWATSKDGLTFKQQGIALDSRNETFEGWMDGPELVVWDGDETKLFFWSYRGVYESTFDGKTFSTPTLAYDSIKESGNPNNKYPTNIPGDPTVIKIGDTWFMYYGATGEASGIHYFTLQ